MKNRIVGLVVLLFVIAGVVLYASVYVVEEGKQAIITQFGEPIKAEQTAGLHFKSPFVQEVHTLEKRLMPWDGSSDSMQTKDKKRIGIDVWARWRIVDPMLFYVQRRTERQGQKLLDDLVNSTVRDIVAVHNLIDVVRRTNDPLEYEDSELERTSVDQVTGNGRDDVEDEILRAVDLEKYGMKLIQVRIKRVNYPESVRLDVYKRMISERLVIVNDLDGRAKKARDVISGETKKMIAAIEGEKEQRSAEIRGEADALVITLTAAAYKESPEFYEFLRRLEVLKTTLGNDTRLILSTKGDLFRLLKGTGTPAP